MAWLAGHVAGAQAPELPQGTFRVDSGRFTVVALARDMPLARSVLGWALERDTFPGLPRPLARVVIAIAPDARRFREWIGPSAPEWGAAVAMPEFGRVVMQGSRANSAAGDPEVTLRHELAHLALNEFMRDVPPRWFDEGYASYAAGEHGRDELFGTNVALALRPMPTLDRLDALFSGGESRAQEGYALAERAVADMASLDPQRGLTLMLRYWRDTRSFDQALRQAYGVTEATFEQNWRAAARRRYGALALVANVTLSALLVLLVIGPLWAIRRQRDRRRLLLLLEADAAQERRERESALVAMLEGSRATAAGDAAPSGGPARADGRDDEQIK